MPRLFRIQLPVLFLLIVSFTTFAFASSHTNDIKQGGEGSQTISGWIVSNVHYHLNDAGAVSTVEFDLDKTAGNVKISISSSDPIYFNCMNAKRFTWVCDTNSLVEVSAMDQLRVVAVGN